MTTLEVYEDNFELQHTVHIQYIDFTTTHDDNALEARCECD
jgi:hypothetical protein